MARAKVLVVGVDGATLPLVQRWIGRGRLPTLARLARGGVLGLLRSVPNLNSAPSWTSIVTGVNPGKHGIFNFQHAVPGQFRVRTVNGSFRQAPALWHLLGQAGLRVGFLNVPMTFPADRVDGFMVSGLDTPGFGSPGWAWPAGLERELPEAVPGYAIDMNFEPFFERGAHGMLEAVRQMQQMAQRRGQAARYLLDRFEPDLFMVVFTATDRVQHIYWRHMDPQHADHDPAEAEVLGTAILDVYRQVDTEIGRLVAAAGPDTHVIVLSDHGFCRTTGAMPFYNVLLRHAGLQRLRAGLTHAEGEGLGGWLTRAKRWMVNNLSRRQLELASRLMGRVAGRVKQAMYFPPLDWPATRAYFPRLRQECFVNLVGREPAGCVRPGDDYDRTVAEVIDVLDRWHDPATGCKVLEQISRRDGDYWGPYAPLAPDVTVRADDRVRVSGIALRADDGTLEPVTSQRPPVVSHRSFSGGHADNGMVLLHGPGVRAGCPPPQARVYDITPTVLYLMDQPVPEELDGRVLDEVFDPAWLGVRPIQRTSAASVAGAAPAEYSDEEEALVQQRLRDLGYVG